MMTQVTSSNPKPNQNKASLKRKHEVSSGSPKKSNSTASTAYKPRWDQKETKLVIDRVGTLNGEPVTYDRSLEIQVKGLTQEQVHALLLGLKLGLELQKSGKLDKNLSDKVPKLAKVTPAQTDSNQPPIEGGNNQNEAFSGRASVSTTIVDDPNDTSADPIDQTETVLITDPVED